MLILSVPARQLLTTQAVAAAGLQGRQSWRDGRERVCRAEFAAGSTAMPCHRVRPTYAKQPAAISQQAAAAARCTVA